MGIGDLKNGTNIFCFFCSVTKKFVALAVQRANVHLSELPFLLSRRKSSKSGYNFGKYQRISGNSSGYLVK